ncbi:unnamed protein product [Cercopithifilaria johnstoni]|uniref:p-granule-associated protein DEPS-1 second OB-fold domain-containing protein n=1 Tax=Cercopithifilaria johnstoni TaxID=2874296 RepID=A0A8J2Q282_9BILA|nr:unnamed protein product [Cercopithifilaria johnstoni]
MKSVLPKINQLLIIFTVVHRCTEGLNTSMSKLIGLISHQTDNGLLHVFVPGKHPDLVIDQRKIPNDERHFHIGDFISFYIINGSVTSPTRTSKLFETRLLNNVLQVKVSVIFPPEELFERANSTAFAAPTKKMLAWSPDFAFVGCSPNIVKTLCRNQMYKAWIKRIPGMVQNIAGVFVSWQIVGDVVDECDEQSKQLIKRAPWNREESSQYFRTIFCPDRPHQMRQKPFRNRHSFAASLKKYTDNYEGLVTAVHDSDAKVWSLAIPHSEVKLQVNLEYNWVPDQSNHSPYPRPYLNCYLQGKKFEIIEPVLPTKAFKDTVRVQIWTTIAVDSLKYYPTGEVTVETETLGTVEFGPRKFRQDYCSRHLSLIISKIMPSERTGAVWQVFCVINKGCMEFMQSLRSVVKFSNKNDNNPSQEFLSTKKNECNAKFGTDDSYHFNESQQQGSGLCHDLTKTGQKEVDNDFYSDFSFGNGDAENLKTKDEYDPLKEPVFGAVEPHVLQINSPVFGKDTDKLGALGNPSTGLNEELSEDEREEIPEVRRKITEADKMYTFS